MADEQSEQPTTNGVNMDAMAGQIMTGLMGIASAYFGEKIKTLNIKNYRLSQLAETHSRDEAQKVVGTDRHVNQWAPFPPLRDVSVTMDTTAAPKEPLWKTALKWAIPAVLGGALTGGSLWGAGLLGIGEKVIERVIEKPVEVPVEGDHQPGEVGLTVE